MVSRFLRWLRGYVVFAIVGKYPERLINLATMANITIINPVGEKGKITAQVSIDDYKALCAMRKRAMVRLRIVKKSGLPFTLHKNRKRKGLLVGVVLFIAITNVLSMFIWNIDIIGNDTVSVYQMQQCLKDNGVYVGAYKGDINVSSAERNFALQLGKVGWMSVNIQGSTATVQLSESYAIPEIVDKTSPCNLKATKTGQVLKMDIRQGENYASVGDGVAKGQLLVSGIVRIGDTGKSRFVRSEGEVYAGVHSSERLTLPVKKEFNMPVFLRQRQLLDFLGFKVPMDLACVDNVYYRRYTTESLCMNGADMPISIITEKSFGLKPYSVKYSESELQKIADVYFALDDIFTRWNCEIVEKEVSSKKNKDSYIFTADYYCIENIAEAVPIEIVNSD
ncbi:MAG: sporulation protein YqfD [Clostridia bacterium]|nr:sporulation protein YqfD [Clostridia bacterium]MEE1125314.1 sporulation protein YqfD [Acutalibacteraceae bacterium]